VARKGARSNQKAEYMSAEPVSADEKIARLLGILATKDIEQIGERVTLLRAVGFGVSEVASILGMTENNVRVATHHGRKKRRRKKVTRRKKN
jgi:DNA-directed RNA polymerase specialized sigma24 family protein